MGAALQSSKNKDKKIASSHLARFISAIADSGTPSLLQKECQTRILAKG
jgi:hypothetical protein